MSFAPVYLLSRALFRLTDFFHHWYADGSRRIGHASISLLRELDRTFAVKITLRYFFVPLYRDYSVVGRILGVIFRTFRILIGSTIYLFLAAIFLLIYLAWLAVPVFILWYAAYGFR